MKIWNWYEWNNEHDERKTMRNKPTIKKIKPNKFLNKQNTKKRNKQEMKSKKMRYATNNEDTQITIKTTNTHTHTYKN